MDIGFVYPHNIAGRFVSWFTWSKFSHVFLWRKPYIVESAPFHGVRILHAPRKEDIPYDRCELFEVPDNDKVFNAMCNESGANYDYGGIFGFMLRRDWMHDQKKWFCSELIAHGYQKAGTPLIKRKTNRVTPQDIWEAVTYLR